MFTLKCFKGCGVQHTYSTKMYTVGRENEVLYIQDDEGVKHYCSTQNIHSLHIYVENQSGKTIDHLSAE